MTRERDLEIIREVIDLREQLYKLSKEAGVSFSVTTFPNQRWFMISADVDVEAEGLYSITNYNDAREDIRYIYHDGRSSDAIDNITLIDLSKLRGENDDVDE